MLSGKSSSVYQDSIASAWIPYRAEAVERSQFPFIITYLLETIMETAKRIMDIWLEIEHNTGATYKNTPLAYKAAVFREWIEEVLEYLHAL